MSQDAVDWLGADLHPSQSCSVVCLCVRLGHSASVAFASQYTLVHILKSSSGLCSYSEQHLRSRPCLSSGNIALAGVLLPCLEGCLISCTADCGLSTASFEYFGRIVNSIPWSFCFYGAHGRGLLLQGSLPCLDLVESHLCWRYALLDARCDSPSGRAPGRSPSWRRRLWNLGLALYLRGHSWGCLKCF